MPIKKTKDEYIIKNFILSLENVDKVDRDLFVKLLDIAVKSADLLEEGSDGGFFRKEGKMGESGDDCKLCGGDGYKRGQVNPLTPCKCAEKFEKDEKKRSRENKVGYCGYCHYKDEFCKCPKEKDTKKASEEEASDEIFPSSFTECEDCKKLEEDGAELTICPICLPF